MVKILALVALGLIAGCSTTAGSFCAIAEPNRPSAATIAVMTDAEIKAALTHNLKGQRLCGWKP